MNPGPAISISRSVAGKTFLLRKESTSVVASSRGLHPCFLAKERTPLAWNSPKRGSAGCTFAVNSSLNSFNVSMASWIFLSRWEAI